MKLPYENCSTGDRAMQEVQVLLRRFGCNKFGVMADDEKGEVIVQFEWRGRMVCIPASYRGYAAAWIKAHPYTPRMRKTQIQHEREAIEKGAIAVYSILRDWIKGQVMAVETGLLSFEGVFLGHLLLPSGKTVLQHATESKLLKLPDHVDGKG